MAATAKSGNVHEKRLEDLSEEEKDSYEVALEKSGCSQFHYALQDCYFEHQDWRKCQKEMAEFKKCTEEQKKLKAAASHGSRK